MTKPLSAEDAGVIMDTYGLWQRRWDAMRAIRDGHHAVVERVTEAEAREKFKGLAAIDRDNHIHGYGKWRDVDWFLAAYRALGAIKGE